MMLYQPAASVASALNHREPLETAAFELRIIDGQSMIGGGCTPDRAIPTRLLAFSGPDLSPSTLEARLRSGSPPIACRLEHDSCCSTYARYFRRMTYVLASKGHGRLALVYGNAAEWPSDRRGELRNVFREWDCTERARSQAAGPDLCG
jgi:hypothetical protein